MAKFCDSGAFNDAVNAAKKCVTTENVCGCLEIEKKSIKDAACSTEPLKSFFVAGCLSMGCDNKVCEF